MVYSGVSKDYLFLCSRFLHHQNRHNPLETKQCAKQSRSQSVGDLNHTHCWIHGLIHKVNDPTAIEMHHLAADKKICIYILYIYDLIIDITVSQMERRTLASPGHSLRTAPEIPGSTCDFVRIKQVV